MTKFEPMIPVDPISPAVRYCGGKPHIFPGFCHTANASFRKLRSIRARKGILSSTFFLINQ